MISLNVTLLLVKRTVYKKNWFIKFAIFFRNQNCVCLIVCGFFFRNVWNKQDRFRLWQIGNLKANVKSKCWSKHKRLKKHRLESPVVYRRLTKMNFSTEKTILWYRWKVINICASNGIIIWKKIAQFKNKHSHLKQQKQSQNYQKKF